MKTNSGPPRYGLRTWQLLLASLLLMQGVNSAFAADVSYRLEGCKFVNNTNTPLENYSFVCSDGAYTTGNLGAGWNELDLVPYRTTLTAGSTAQTYTIAFALDSLDQGHIGYDVISAPVRNTTLSTAGCPDATYSGQLTANTGGGTEESIYRLITITGQPAGSTCVYDWYGRLGLGSHEYPGSSLHANLFNENLESSGIGKREVSIPVKEILPQELSKTMSAYEDTTVAWDLSKSATPATRNFGDVCSPTPTTDLPATITVTWTKLAAAAGEITFVTHVSATNPSARTITVNVSDVIYKGAQPPSGPALDTLSSGPVDVPPNTTMEVLEHPGTLPSTDGLVGDYLNDVATATYTDKVTGIPIPGDTTASAQAQITQGSVNNGTADITDSESITGTGLTFSVPTPPSVGSFTNYLGGATVGPVNWQALGQTSSGSVEFDKTIYITGLQVTTGTLSDTAHLNPLTDDLTANGSISISSTANVKLTVSKTIPAEYLTNYLNQPGDLLKVYFHISGAGGYTNDFMMTFANGGTDSQSQDFGGLTPDTYTVTETGSELCPGGTCTDPPTSSFLAPVFNDLSTTHLTVPANGDMTGRCSETISFENELQSLGVRARVQKITDPVLLNTDPDYDWTFTLNGPNVSTCLPAVAGAGAGYVVFQDSLGGDCLLSDGDYTVTETLISGWLEHLATPNDGLDTLVCAFSVNLITDDGQTKSCTFENWKYGHASVVKTVSGLPPSGTDAFTFQLREGASVSADGTILESLIANAGNGGVLNFVTDLVPGNHYQLCELVPPGWLTSLTNTFLPPSNSVDGATCTDFTAVAGDTTTFNVDNTPPPGGEARTIGYWRNWSSCSNSNGNQTDVLGDTLADADPTGIRVGSFYLHAGDQCKATNLLSKRTMTNGDNKASDPVFRLAAQLIAAELNVVAGAGTCPAVTSAISSANTLLAAVNFNGDTHTTLTKAQATLANSLATTLDMYNNNLLCF